MNAHRNGTKSFSDADAGIDITEDFERFRQRNEILHSEMRLG